MNVSRSDGEGLMKLWGLETYSDLLIIEEGWDNTEDWIDIEYDYLKSIGFKEGHARRFIKKAKDLF